MKAQPLILIALIFTAFHAQAKLVHSLDEEFSQKQLRIMAFEYNNHPLDIKTTAYWLKKVFPEKQNQKYVDKIYLKTKNKNLKPKLFYYPTYLEVRMYGKSYGKIDEIDPLNHSVNLNGQTITFSDGQDLEKLHKQVMSALQFQSALNLQDLFFPKAYAQYNETAIWSLLAFYAMIPLMRSSQSTHNFEGQLQRVTYKDLCDNPTNRATISRILTQDYLRDHTGQPQQASQNEISLFAYTFQKHDPNGLAPLSSCTSYWLNQRKDWANKAQRVQGICQMARRAKRLCVQLKKSEDKKTKTPEPAKF
ncbi:MAG: hypothetical protein KDD33_12855 [Bdellovibrionales bacterium]|nr:hypothetical protein [Bdellovibrionales bacterium]